MIKRIIIISFVLLCAFIFSVCAEAGKIPVILDTDIGGDPDDAFALLLTLNSPELCLDLVVTNDEHKNHRAMFTKLWLKAMKKEIPVAAGVDLGKDKWCLVDKLVQGCAEPDTNYLDAMARVVDANEKTDFVCIGKQSNLARLIERLKQVMR